MQNAKSETFGVSPAYFLSRYGESFRNQDITAALPDIARLGYTAFQMEAFTPDAAVDWSGQRVRELARSASLNGLAASQFVAHWYGETLTCFEGLRSNHGMELFRRVVGEVVEATGVPIVTVPLLPFVDADAPFSDTWSVLLEIVAAAGRVVSFSGAILAVEVTPGSLVGSSFGFLQLSGEIGEPWLGFNLDTGNANAAGEIIPHLVSRIGARVVGTHLCDNDGKANSSDPPGTGSVPWKTTMAMLRQIGYQGSLDIEIRCAEHALENEYGRALRFVRSILQQLP
jgi:sugar phosphate isomerase/epimerase